jgi:hypothetical protein
MKQPSGTVLRVYIGKKTPKKLADTARLEFDSRTVAATPDYLQIVRNAKAGAAGHERLPQRIGSNGAALDEQLEKRLQNGFSAAEQYRRQLHEMNRGE